MSKSHSKQFFLALLACISLGIPLALLHARSATARRTVWPLSPIMTLQLMTSVKKGFRRRANDKARLTTTSDVWSLRRPA